MFVYKIGKDYTQLNIFMVPYLCSAWCRKYTVLVLCEKFYIIFGVDLAPELHEFNYLPSEKLSKNKYSSPKFCLYVKVPGLLITYSSN